MRIAQAPRPGTGESALISVAPAAGPRPGQGESALIGGAPAAQGGPAAEPAAPVAAQGAQDSATGQAADPQATGLKTWKIPPIRWGGYFAAELQGMSMPGQPRRMQMVESANITASSYLWEPWFAQVSGGLTLLTSQQRGGENNVGVSGAAGGHIKSTSLTGDGQLSLFPMSRFPFTAAYSQSDSRASGELTTSPFTSRRYTLTQGFTPLDGRSSYRLSYVRSDLDSEAFGVDTAKALTGSMNWGSDASTLSVMGSRYANSRSRGGDTSAVDTVNATHSYRAGPTFSVNSLVNFSDSDYHIASGTLPMDLRSRFLQANSFATWRPAENSPLLVTGGARLFQSRAGSGGASAEATTLSANAAVTYALSRNTTLSGGGTVTRLSNGASESLFTQASAGIDYASDIARLGEYGYSWNVGANAGGQTGGDGSKSYLRARADHRLTRSFALAEGSALFVNASQNYSRINDSLLSTSETLVHSAGASWNRRAGESATTLLSLDVSDSRTWGFSAQQFQLANLLASGQIQVNRWSSFSANMTLQATRQGTSTAYAASAGVPPIARTSVSVGGNATYQHTRAFGVPRLNYFALLNINQRQQRTRLEGDINAPLEHVDWSFEQRLEHNIGRLETRLSMRFAKVEGKTNGLIFLRLLRRFGD